MCGSTNDARRQAFANAAVFYAAKAKEQIGDEAPKGNTRQHIAFIESLGGGAAPAEIVALADAEDAHLAAVREVQIAQKGILDRVLNEQTIVTGGNRVEAFVAALNVAATTEAALNKAGEAYDAKRDEVLAEAGINEDGPVTLQ
jgi:hypothetical protein